MGGMVDGITAVAPLYYSWLGYVTATDGQQFKQTLLGASTAALGAGLYRWTVTTLARRARVWHEARTIKTDTGASKQ